LRPGVTISKKKNTKIHFINNNKKSMKHTNPTFIPNIKIAKLKFRCFAVVFETENKNYRFYACLVLKL